MSLIIDEIEDVLEEQELHENDTGVEQNEECRIKWMKSISKKCIHCKRLFMQERKPGIRKTR